jgi:hypothetical protein
VSRDTTGEEGTEKKGLYAISLLESADVLFSARYLDTAEIWKEKNRTFAACAYTPSLD